MYKHTNTHIQTHTQTHTHTLSISLFLSLSLSHTHTHTHSLALSLSLSHTHTHAHTHTHTHTHTYKYANAHAHTHKLSLTHTNMCIDRFMYVSPRTHYTNSPTTYSYFQLYISVHQTHTSSYGVASTSRLLKIIGLFCKRALSKRRYSAKETCNFKEPTNRSHPIYISVHQTV